MLVARRSWFHYLSAVRGTVLVRIWPRVAIAVAVSIGVTIAHERAGWFGNTLTTLPFTLIGLPLGIYLGFRNNTSYDRFWEGRKLWGRLVNTTRSLTREILCLVGPQPGMSTPRDADDLSALHRAMVYRVIAYVHVFRHHLRDSEPRQDVADLLPPPEVAALSGESNRPVAVLASLGEAFREAWLGGLVHSQHLPVLERSLTDLTDIQGGCERIKSTPIPFSYTVLIHRIVATYALTLPFGIVDTAGMFTPLVVLLIAYAFFALDAIGDEIENPFGLDDNDLPLSTLSRMIEVNLRQRLGETELPPLLQPVDGVLM